MLPQILGVMARVQPAQQIHQIDCRLTRLFVREMAKYGLKRRTPFLPRLQPGPRILALAGFVAEHTGEIEARKLVVASSRRFRTGQVSHFDLGLRAAQ